MLSTMASLVVDLERLCAAAYRMENYNPIDKQMSVKALLEFRTRVRDSALEIFQYIYNSDVVVSPHAQYEVAHILREALTARWSLMALEMRQQVFHLVTSTVFSWRAGQLEMFVERQYWVTVAFLLKRSRMSPDEDCNFMKLFLAELEKIMTNRDDPRCRMAIEQLLEILNEMTNMDDSRFRAFVPRLEYYKGKKRFEDEELTRIFLVVINFIRSMLSEGDSPDHLANALFSAVRCLEVIFNWTFLPDKLESTNFLTFQRRIAFIQGHFRPGPNWRPLLTDDNILTFFFMAFLKFRSDENFEASTVLAGCLSQLVTAQENSIRSFKDSEHYRLKFLSWSVELLDQVMANPNVDGDFEALVNFLHQLVQTVHAEEILAPRTSPASASARSPADSSAADGASNGPSAGDDCSPTFDASRGAPIVERLLRHVVAFLCQAMRRAALEVVEETLSRPYEYIEDRAMMAFHHALTQCAIQMRAPDAAQTVAPEALALLRRMAQEVFEVFMQSRLCVPFGFRNMATDGSPKPTLEYDRQEFDEDCDEEDRELYLTCLEAAGLCVRFAPEHCLPLLSSQLLRHRLELKRADPGNTLLLEDLHWLLMVATHSLVNFDGGSPEAGVPQELVDHSLMQVHRAGNSLDLPGLYNCLARSPDSLISENVDDITILVAVVLSYIRESNHVTSPQVMKDILWLIRSVSRAYFYRSVPLYHMHSNGGVGESEGSQLLLVRLLLDPGPDGCPLLVHILDMLSGQTVHVIHQWWQSHEVLLELTDMWNEIAQCKMLSPILLMTHKWRSVVADLCELQPPFAHLNPSHIRDLVTAACVVCVHVNTDHPQFEVYFQKLSSVVTRFEKLLSEVPQRSTDAALRHQVVVGLYAVHGLVRALPGGVHLHRLFALLQPVLERSQTVLFDSYSGFDEVIQPLLQTVRDFVQQASVVLRPEEWEALHRTAYQLLRAFAAHNTTSLAVVEEEKQASLCANLSVMMDMMYHSLQENLFLFDDGPESEAGSTNSRLADFIVFGLATVVPLIDFKALPTLPELTDRYFTLIANVASIYPSRVLKLAPELHHVFMSSIQWAVTESLSDRIMNMGYEMLSFLTEHIHKAGAEERALYQSSVDFLEAMLRQYLGRLLDQDNPIDVSLHFEQSDALLGLICVCPAAYEATVQELATQQPDEGSRAALIQAFHKLTPHLSEVGISRMARAVFRQRLEEFLTEVRRSHLVR